MLFEKYRPKSFDEIKGQENVVRVLKNLSGKKFEEIPNLMFVGPPGCGKTSAAICLARELWGDQWKRHYLEFNASDERGIDVIRNKIIPLLNVKGERMIFMDEADSLTTDAQQALRRPSEKSKSTLLILSLNKEWKIIDPIKSRCLILRFRRLKDVDILRRLLEICKKEGVKVTAESKEGFKCILKEANGDMRKAINILEKLIDSDKKIDVKNVVELRMPKMVSEALQVTLSGDFERGKELLEDAYINSGFLWEEIVKKMFDALDEVKDREVKIRLYQKLAETEGYCKMGGNPIIQLTGFLSYVWIAPHLPKSCPALVK